MTQKNLLNKDVTKRSFSLPSRIVKYSKNPHIRTFSLRKKMFDHLSKNLFYPNFYKRFLFKLCKIISVFLSIEICMYMIQDKHN